MSKSLGSESVTTPTKPTHKHHLAPAKSKVLSFLSSIKISGALIALLLAMPLLTLILLAVLGNGESFQFIYQTVLADYVINTLLLIFWVALIAVIIGVPSAWLIAVCDFPGRKFFNWAMVLPLAMPAYVIAYVYTDLLDYAGPVQITLRGWFGWQSAQDYWFFDIRTIPGAAIMLALVLFPYVYLITRSNFKDQTATMTHAARTLGLTPWQSFIRISFPLARKAIVAGTALVLMEALADFATVHYFAVNTLTTAVYDTWLGHYDLASAAKLSALMVMGVFVLLYLEKVQGRNKQVGDHGKVSQYSLRYKLTGKKAVAATAFCFGILLIAFILPAFILLGYVVDYFDQSWRGEVWQYSFNSVVIALITAFVATSIAVLLNYINRHRPTISNKVSLHLASSGYAIPGTVMAIGVLIPLSFLDTSLNQLARAWQIPLPGLVLSGTLIAIVVAHVCRFTAIANKGIEAGFSKISHTLDDAGRSLNHNRRQLLKRVHLPLLKPSIVVAFLLIFVESMKELSAALLLRPFDFQTLPTYVYQYASDEQLELASLGALFILLVGLIPLLVLNRSMDSNR